MATRFRCPRYEGKCDRCPARAIFSCLTAAQDAALGHERLARHYATGQVVVHYDTPAPAVLSVHSGRVKLVRSAENGDEVLVGVRGPGELLGVPEALSGLPYQASVLTLGKKLSAAWGAHFPEG